MSKAISLTHREKKQDFPPPSTGSSITLALTKREKRKLFRDKNKRKKKFEIKKASKALSNMLSQLNIWEQGLTVAVYHALPDELSTEDFQKSHQHKLRFAFPQIRENSNTMRFVFGDLKDQKNWEKAPWPKGIQPSGEESVSLEKIDVFLVPGVAFDRVGNRLGRGRGFYDRTLYQAKGFKIGVAGAHQISNEILPKENHDVRMSAVLTESFLLVPLKHTQFWNIKGDQ